MVGYIYICGLLFFIFLFNIFFSKVEFYIMDIIEKYVFVIYIDVGDFMGVKVRFVRVDGLLVVIVF